MVKWSISMMTAVALCLATSLSIAAEAPIGPRLQQISANVCCPSSLGSTEKVQGSGTLIKDTVGGQSTTWLLTAHHVVKDLRDVKTVISSDGEEKKQVVYRDARVIQEQVEAGRSVGEQSYDAKVISVDPRRDIALLRVRYGAFAKDSAAFFLDDEIPLPGTEVYHCGAPGGKEIGGTCSLTDGIVSRLGVRIPEFGGAEHGVFDQCTADALGGSSGGMVALKADGRWVGMITLGLRGADSFHWMVPVRSVREWAKQINAEWLLNPSLPRPSEDDVKKIPLELNPPGFAAIQTVKELPTITIEEHETMQRLLPY